MLSGPSWRITRAFSTSRAAREEVRRPESRDSMTVRDALVKKDTVSTELGSELVKRRQDSDREKRPSGYGGDRNRRNDVQGLQGPDWWERCSFSCRGEHARKMRAVGGAKVATRVPVRRNCLHRPVGSKSGVGRW